MEALINSILKEMGVDPNGPARWIVNIDRIKDQTTGEILREYPRGYLCSKCGKHSWTKKEKCDGCGSVMSQRRATDA